MPRSIHGKSIQRMKIKDAQIHSKKMRSGIKKKTQINTNVSNFAQTLTET
jgi:hypothetical protein